MMIKCLIWDLDDTLWQGTLSENWDVFLPGERREFILRLDGLGILQSIASRNDEDLVMRKLEELGIRQYFLYPQCNFGSKVESIRKIVTALNIGMEAAGYIDDNPFEIFEVQYFLPKVHTYPADQWQNILEYPEFNLGKVTREASTRRQMMIARQKRESAERQFAGSREDFLKECRMELAVRSAQIEDVDRINELAGRTNQLNSMKTPLDETMILGYIHASDKQVLVAELKDRFGDHGIIGACFLEMESTLILIRLFCISCRIEGRGVGVAFLGEVIRRLQAEHPGMKEIRCLFKSSDRNRPALMLLKMLGFQCQERKEEYSIYSLPLPRGIERVEWVKIS
jgi:methoxymalonate biosynthesis protein